MFGGVAVLRSAPDTFPFKVHVKKMMPEFVFYGCFSVLLVLVFLVVSVLKAIDKRVSQTGIQKKSKNKTGKELITELCTK